MSRNPKFITMDERLAQGNWANDSILDSITFRRAVEAGDWEQIAVHLESGGKVTPLLRELFINFLRGNANRANHRPPKDSTTQHLSEIESYVAKAEQTMTPAAAKKAAMKKFRVSYTTVRRALKTRGEIEEY
jgi:hypothetical protein